DDDQAYAPGRHTPRGGGIPRPRSGGAHAVARRARPSRAGFRKGRPEAREHWTYKDTLAHILFWKQWQMETIAGRPHEVRPTGRTVHLANRRIYDKWKTRPARDIV